MKMTNVKLAYRRALKKSTTTLINITGLSIGIACAILLTSWVIHELSYDTFVKDSDQIYRITLEGTFDGQYVNSAQSPGGIAPEASKIFPEIENYTRLVTSRDVIIKTEDNVSFKESGYAADPSFFEVFPLEVKYGNLSNCLNENGKVVIDEYLAFKSYGSVDPVGKSMVVDGLNYTISAVIENIPSNSHLQFHFLTPLMNVSWFRNQEWNGDNSITYLKLIPNSNIREINHKITELAYAKKPMWKELKVNFGLQSLRDIHLSNFTHDYAKTGNKKHIYIFAATALLVLLIACINFINLFIASSLKKKHEIGIRITNGASKFSILKEYFVEVLLYVLVSFIASIALIKAANPYFNLLAGDRIEIHIFSTHFLMIGLPVALVTIMLASGFPWIYINKLTTTEVLKKGASGSGKKFSILQSLVTFQFVVAIILIFNLITIEKQLHFLKTKDLGFDKENILYVHTDGILQQVDARETLKNVLLKNKNITAIAYQGSIPTNYFNGSPFSKTTDNQNIVPTEQIFIDKDYFDLMKIKFINGENIFKQSDNPSNYCIVNQQVIQSLNLTPPYLDKVIYKSVDNNKPLIIKGIVKIQIRNHWLSKLTPAFMYCLNGLIVKRSFYSK